jgi:hypothetical protein
MDSVHHAFAHCHVDSVCYGYFNPDAHRHCHANFHSDCYADSHRDIHPTIVVPLA